MFEVDNNVGRTMKKHEVGLNESIPTCKRDSEAERLFTAAKCFLSLYNCIRIGPIYWSCLCPMPNAQLLLLPFINTLTKRKRST